MKDREFCDRSAALAADVVRAEFAHLEFGAVGYPAFGAGVVLFFGQVAAQTDEAPPVVARLREFLAIEEVGIRELGFGMTPDARTWAMLAQSGRDVEYGRRLIAKAAREAGRARSPGRSGFPA
jgi:hypothetical protein